MYKTQVLVDNEDNERIIRSILGWSEEDTFQVTDKYLNLYMIHGDKGRGVIIDFDKKEIVIDACEYIPTYEAKGPIYKTNEEEYDAIECSDSEGISFRHLISKDDIILPGFESTFIRTFIHNGEFFFSTRKKLRAFNAFWGKQPTFYQFFQKYVDVDKLKELLVTVPYASFLLISENVNFSSRFRDVGVYHTEDSPLKDKYPEIKTINPISFQIANQWLFPETEDAVKDEGKEKREGMIYFEDEGKSVHYTPYRVPSDGKKRKMGEFIVIKKQNGKMIRINSPSYHYSSKVIGVDDSNPYHRFCIIALEIMAKGLIVLPNMLGIEPRYISEYAQEDLKNNKENSVLYWSKIFEQVIGIHHEDEAQKFFSRLNEDFRNLISFLKTQYPNWKTRIETVVVNKAKECIINRNEREILYELHTKTGDLKKYMINRYSSATIYRLFTSCRKIQMFFNNLQ